MSAAEPEHNYVTINFEETELRLGLPGGKRASLPDHHHPHDGRKRGFSETVDLKLNLSSIAKMDGGDHEVEMKKGDAADEHGMIKDKSSAAAAAVAAANSNNDPAKPPAAKAQVVGWPPVRSFRKNVMAVQKTHHNNSNGDQTNNNSERNHKPAASATTATSVGAAVAAAFVKVSMDGAPYLRKVDLRLYNSYNELSEALGKMFSSFTIGMKDFNLMSESKLVDVLNGSEYVPTYQDKDGDWMLVGDVPWKMFVESCKRLRLMKGSEAIGLAPRAVEKCKNRS